MLREDDMVANATRYSYVLVYFVLWYFRFGAVHFPLIYFSFQRSAMT